MLGFTERVISDDLSLFVLKETSFYLQDYYVEEWVNNTMLFLEVKNVQVVYESIVARRIEDHFGTSRLSALKDRPWGREFFLHDPAGNLWHIGTFTD